MSRPPKYDRAAIIDAARRTMSLKQAAELIGCNHNWVRAILKKDDPGLLAEIRMSGAGRVVMVCAACETKSVAPGSDFCGAACASFGAPRRDASGLARYGEVYRLRAAGKSWRDACAEAGLSKGSVFGAPVKVKAWGRRAGVDVSAAFGFVAIDTKMSS